MVDQPMIVVRGEAFREVPPEQAVFSVTASARDKDRDATLSRLTQRDAEVRTLLDGYPELIDRRETGGVQIFPEIKRGSEKVVAYTGSVTTTVTVSDFAALGMLLMRLAGLEQTSVSGPWWRLRPGSRAGADVRREAVADAFQRARDYAEAVGARLDRLLEIQDDGAGGAHPMARAMMAEVAADDGLQIDPQLQTVQATVVLRFAMTEPDLSARA